MIVDATFLFKSVVIQSYYQAGFETQMNRYEVHLNHVSLRKLWVIVFSSPRQFIVMSLFVSVAPFIEARLLPTQSLLSLGLEVNQAAYA